jgi:glycogen operon protein
MGVEGPTEDAEINARRERQMRNFLTTLMLSQGVPMLCGGDEVARTQGGNNNAYCQDNEISWFDWNLDERRKRLRDFTGKLINLRLAHPNLHRRKFFQDREIRKKGNGELLRVIKDVAWFNTDGNEFSDEAWGSEWTRAIGLLLNGQTLQVSNEDGEWVIDDSFCLMVNAADQGVEFIVPLSPSGNPWCVIIDTENIDNPFVDMMVGEKIIVGGRALKLLSDQAYQLAEALSSTETA